MSTHSAVQVGGPPRQSGTVRLPTPSEELLTERIALFTRAMAGERAAGMLEGLADSRRQKALEIASELASLGSASRQGRLAAAFGERRDAPERLRDLLRQATAPLRGRIAQAVPPYLAPQAPSPRVDSPARRLDAFARRLAREAIR